jgi:hypothetical protein
MSSHLCRQQLLTVLTDLQLAAGGIQWPAVDERRRARGGGQCTRQYLFVAEAPASAEPQGGLGMTLLLQALQVC